MAIGEKQKQQQSIRIITILSLCHTVYLLGIVQRNAKRHSKRESVWEWNKEQEQKETSFLFPSPSLHGLLNEKSKHPIWFSISMRVRKREAKVVLEYFVLFCLAHWGKPSFSKFWIACHKKEFCSIPIPHCL